MNKDSLKKCSGFRVKFRPIAKRFDGGQDGVRLQSIDDDWIIYPGDAVVRISNDRTRHSSVLGYDHIHHFTSDPTRGPEYGFLTLNVQVNIGSNDLWIEPTRPGEETPDPASTKLTKRDILLFQLREKYISTHDNIPPGIGARIEWPPVEWLNAELSNLGESWQVAPGRNNAELRSTMT